MIRKIFPFTARQNSNCDLVPNKFSLSYMDIVINTSILFILNLRNSISSSSSCIIEVEIRDTIFTFERILPPTAHRNQLIKKYGGWFLNWIILPEGQRRNQFGGLVEDWISEFIFRINKYMRKLVCNYVSYIGDMLLYSNKENNLAQRTNWELF